MHRYHCHTPSDTDSLEATHELSRILIFLKPPFLESGKQTGSRFPARELLLSFTLTRPAVDDSNASIIAKKVIPGAKTAQDHSCGDGLNIRQCESLSFRFAVFLCAPLPTLILETRARPGSCLKQYWTWNPMMAQPCMTSPAH
jgi:hypothetical protein